MEAKIYEFHGNFGTCLVCALDRQQAKELIWAEYKDECSPITFSFGQEIPEVLYHLFTMQEETEKGTDTINFIQYMKNRKEDEFKILTSLNQ